MITEGSQTYCGDYFAVNTKSKSLPMCLTPIEWGMSILPQFLKGELSKHKDAFELLKHF